MRNRLLRLHELDNIIVALDDIQAGETLSYQHAHYEVIENIPAKHKFAAREFHIGDAVIMYGGIVGLAVKEISAGALISTENIHHAAGAYQYKNKPYRWSIPDTQKFSGRQFMGFHRADGRVGTANYWLVVPMVFCENRNLEVLKELLRSELGFAHTVDRQYRLYLRSLLGKTDHSTTLHKTNLERKQNFGSDPVRSPYFPNVDGIQFLDHSGGCGGTRDDARALCGLLAGYITHPNVAGATVLSLGCQHAQVDMLNEEIALRDPGFSKPLYILEQQQIGTEEELIRRAIKTTLSGLAIADQARRQPADLNKLCIGLECGGSDGFSGISANPAMGYCADLAVALGASVILSEFPELCGVEQEILDRCENAAIAQRFIELMENYNQRAIALNSGFDMNPSPGNIRDGLITDAIKSFGAARKAGSSPVCDVLDYPQIVRKQGLNLLCTPGNDVESTTAEVAAGANIVIFSTGLGTPTGNPVAPVVKISSNTELFQKMPDIIDINTGGIIEGTETIEMMGEKILDHIIQIASGNITAKAVKLQQNDFIPWKRGISL